MSNVERIPDNLQGSIPGTCMTYCPASNEATWLSTTVHNSCIFIVGGGGGQTIMMPANIVADNPGLSISALRLWLEPGSCGLLDSELGQSARLRKECAEWVTQT